MRNAYPILEFDPEPEAVIEPRRVIQPIDIPEHCVICFFQEVINELAAKQRLKTLTCQKSEIGMHPVYELEGTSKPLALFHPGVGAPLAAGLLEEVIALGCKKFIACGGAGVLDRDIALGHVIVPRLAVRDEGTSYHYLPPGRQVSASPEAVTAIEETLKKRACPYLVGNTWTTDGLYRETAGKVALRKAEGCLTVEMEAAALFAVAQFRKVILGQILYGGDDVSGRDWDSRHWDKSVTVRERLLWLAAEACLVL
jgi:uridine phosphorylase